jgi:hypothetical protein
LPLITAITGNLGSGRIASSPASPLQFRRIIMENTARYRDAKRHVERKLGFLVHLSVYVLVNTGLILLNLSLQPHRWWALGPLLGWGIGLLFHGLAVVLHAPGAGWKQRMIENQMKKQPPPPSA